MTSYRHIGGLKCRSGIDMQHNCCLVISLIARPEKKNHFPTKITPRRYDGILFIGSKQQSAESHSYTKSR